MNALTYLRRPMVVALCAAAVLLHIALTIAGGVR